MRRYQEETRQDQKARGRRPVAVWDTAQEAKHQDVPIQKEGWAWAVAVETAVVVELDVEPEEDAAEVCAEWDRPNDGRPRILFF